MDNAGPMWKTEYGDGRIARRNEILRSVVGSGLHGIAIEGTDDHDEMGIYIEPPTHLLGVGTLDDRGVFGEHRRDYQARTQPEGARSGPGDTDLIIYSLGKYLRLALKGNPTALLPLYAPNDKLIINSYIGESLRSNRGLFLSQRALHRFMGYMEAQHDRMMGWGKRNRVPKRQELIDAYGWDTKYGSHALRLAYQGLEIAKEGRLSLPLPEDLREEVLAVKKGEVPRHEVSARIADIQTQLQHMLDLDTTVLPTQPDIQAIESWAITARRWHWDWRDVRVSNG